MSSGRQNDGGNTDYKNRVIIQANEQGKTEPMRERMLRCPRCDARSPAKAGQCTSCGLAMYTTHRREKLGPDAPPGRFLLGRGRKKRQMSNGLSRRGTSRREEASGRSRFDMEDLIPQRPGHKEGEAPVATGLTSFYDMSELKKQKEVKPRVVQNETEVDPYDGTVTRKKGSRMNYEPPAGGDVEVGSMANILMDPSDNPHEADGDTPSFSPSSEGDFKLDLAPRAYGDDLDALLKPKPAPEQPNEKLSSGGLEMKVHPKRMQEEPVYPEVVTPEPEPPIRPSEKVEVEEKSIWQTRGTFLLKWLLPQVILLLIVMSVGPSYIHSNYILEGAYDAIFADDSGRQVECSTIFKPEGAKVSGMFECKLYPNRYSTERVDEPKVLKPIMGNGNIVYTGRYDAKNIQLTLGSIEESDTRSVSLTARFDPDINRAVGVTSNTLDFSGIVELTKVETYEE